MNIKSSNQEMWSMVAAVALVLFLAPCAKGDSLYSQTNLVSDVPGLAVTTSPDLVNPWGISNSATSPYWISDEGTGLSTLYNGAGAITNLVVTIQGGSPTGTVNNSGGGFLVGGASANFIFATLDGNIDARAVGSTASTEATVSGASFTGLALATDGGSKYLYAADFVNGGGIQVFDSGFNNVSATTFANKFVDPNIPAAFAPFNVQLIGNDLYVTYAEVGPTGAAVHNGGGIVDVFDLSGNYLETFYTAGPLEAPWGITMAPSHFGAFSNDILVGNFGNGEINAFTTTGSFVGTLDSAPGTPLVNSNLWALEFGNGNAGSNADTLYFTAGIDNQKEGLFGAIKATPEPSSLLLLATGLFGIVGSMRKRIRQYLGSSTGRARV